MPIVTSALEIGTRRVGNRRTSRDYPNYSIVQNIEKSPGDPRRVAVKKD